MFWRRLTRILTLLLALASSRALSQSQKNPKHPPYPRLSSVKRHQKDPPFPGTSNAKHQITNRTSPRTVWLVGIDRVNQMQVPRDGPRIGLTTMPIDIYTYIQGVDDNGPLSISLGCNISDPSHTMSVEIIDWTTSNHDKRPGATDCVNGDPQEVMNVGTTISRNIDFFNPAYGKGIVIDAISQDRIYRYGPTNLNDTNTGADRIREMLTSGLNIKLRSGMLNLLTKSNLALATFGTQGKIPIGRLNFEIWNGDPNSEKDIRAFTLVEENRRQLHARYNSPNDVIAKPMDKLNQQVGSERSLESFRFSAPLVSSEVGSRFSENLMVDSITLVSAVSESAQVADATVPTPASVPVSQACHSAGERFTLSYFSLPPVPVGN